MRTIRLLIFIPSPSSAQRSCARRRRCRSRRSPPRHDAVADTDTRSVRLLVGRSTLVDVATPISRVSLTSSDVADALVTSPEPAAHQRQGAGHDFDVRVGPLRRHPPLRGGRAARPRAARRAGPPAVSRRPDRRPEQRPRRRAVGHGREQGRDREGDQRRRRLRREARRGRHAAAGARQRRQQPGAAARALRGSQPQRDDRARRILFTGANGYKNVLGRTTTGQAPAPTFDIRHLGQQAGLQRLPQPLPLRREASARHGHPGAPDQGDSSRASPSRTWSRRAARKPASSPAAKFPIPIAQGSGANLAISVQYKEFGVRLNFTPIVTGDRIHLKVRPEVSTLDFTNAVVAERLPHSGAEHAANRDRNRA